MIGIVWQTVKRIIDEILEKGFKNKQTNKQTNNLTNKLLLFEMCKIHLEIKINLHSSEKYPYTFDS